MMQGNQLGDLWTTFRRILLQLPWRVPSGLRVVWLLFWVLIGFVVWYFTKSGVSFSEISADNVIAAIVGGGTTATVLTWIVTKFLPGKIASSFVDVVRYLDTSPRSYGVRKKIRKGMVDFLQSLHDEGRYQRIVVVAHSLGAYVAYDGITFLWTQMNQKRSAGENCGIDQCVLEKLETEAQKLQKDPTADQIEFRKSQRELWRELRKQGNPWLVTDFVTAGTPMYMADQLLTKTRKDFNAKIDRRDIATCPPESDLPSDKDKGDGKTDYAYPYNGGQVLYHAAPFAVVRWSNMWFPAHLGFFGDWFGGPLRPLYGNGILDTPLSGNGWRRFLPAWAHTLYFTFPEDESDESVTAKLHQAMELDSQSWLQDFVKKPEH